MYRKRFFEFRGDRTHSCLDGVTSFTVLDRESVEGPHVWWGMRDLLHGVYSSQDERNTILPCKAWKNFGPAAFDAVTDVGLSASDVRASKKAARAHGLKSDHCVVQMVASTATFLTIIAHFALHLRTQRARAVALAVLRDTIWAVLVRREESHRLETSDLEGLPEPVCELMPSVGVLTCGAHELFTSARSTSDEHQYSCVSVAGHARKQSAVWESAYVCNGRLVHNRSD